MTSQLHSQQNSPTPTFRLDFIPRHLRLFAMRKLGSLLVILLLLTAYGRCVADQLGALHTTASSCCQVVCDQADHCQTSEADLSEDSCCGSDHDTDHHHSKESEPDDSSPEDPAPCGLCLIISSDSMLLNDDVKVPTPTLLELSSLFFMPTLNGLLDQSRPNLNLDNSPSEHPDPPAEHRSQLRRIIAKTTPVRGPSIV